MNIIVFFGFPVNTFHFYINALCFFNSVFNEFRRIIFFVVPCLLYSLCIRVIPKMINSGKYNLCFLLIVFQKRETQLRLSISCRTRIFSDLLIRHYKKRSNIVWFCIFNFFLWKHLYVQSCQFLFVVYIPVSNHLL